MISEETKEKINYDFKDIDNLINNNDHIVRTYYHMFLNGDYGQDIFNKYFNLYEKANNKEKKLRALAIQSFIEYNSIDYGLSYNQVRYYLKKHIGLNNLEKLNIELIKDIKNIYDERVE
tara:strand:+ start:72 stop:428 length:357 start_codon:yes stop_codon:yes gene_type:complete